MPATLREISEKLSLSPGLVSRVLNNRPGVRATPETVTRIRKYADQLDYRPNAAARSLRFGKTRVVAFVSIVPHEKHERMGMSQAAEGIAEALFQIDYSVLIKVFNSEQEIATALTLLVHESMCDAIALWGNEGLVEPQGRLLEKLGMPFVVKGRHEIAHPDWLQVDYDHEAMMAVCVDKLASLGHERIAYIGFGEQRPFQQRTRAGFEDAMARRFGRMPDIHLVADVAPGIESAEEQMRTWMELSDVLRPTALVLGASDNPMWGVERALARSGRRVGYGTGEFAVTGMMKPDTPLLFGEADGYAASGMLALTEAQTRQQLVPLLTGDRCTTPIVRVLPNLQRLKSMHLQEIKGNHETK